MDTIEEKTETSVIQKPIQIFDSNSLPLLLSNSDNNLLLSEEHKYLQLLSFTQERFK